MCCASRATKKPRFPPDLPEGWSERKAPAERPGFLFDCSSLRGAKQRSNPGVGCTPLLDCFAELVIGPATSGRTRWLAMTPRCVARSAAVENVVAEILHLQDRGIGPAGQRRLEMGVDHFADHDVMVALLDDRGDAAFDRARRLGENWRAGRALAVRLATELAFADHGRLEEAEGHALVVLAEHVERKCL